MGSASLSSSIINLVLSNLGAGILVMPFVFAQTGILLGIAVLLFCGVSHIFALHLLALCVLKGERRGEVVSFYSLSHIAFGGRRCASTFVSICVIVATFGIGVGYMIIIGDLLPELFEYLAIDGFPWNSRVFWMTTIGWIVELPLSFLQNLNSLRFSSMFGVIGVVYIVIAVCCFSSGAVSLPHLPAQSFSILPPAHSKHTSIAGMIESLPIFVSAISCAENIPTLVVELAENTVGRVDTVIVATVGLCSVVYVVVGICGVTAFGASVDGNALKSFPCDPGTPAAHVSFFVRIAVVMNVMGCIPLAIHPLRETISMMVAGKQASDLKRSVRWLMTLIIFISVWTFSLVIPSLDEVLAFIGSTGDLILGFTLPALFFCLIVRSQAATANVEDGESGVCSFEVRIQKSPGPLRRLAWTMAIVSFVLMPLLLSAEVYLTLSEH